MEIRTVPISKINPAPYNPRKDLQPGDPEYEKLEKSIEEFGMVEILVWNERSDNLVGGHQRYKILKRKGIKKTEVSVVNLDPHKEAALNIALNKIQGEWDYPKLKDLITEIDTGDFDIEITGFDEIELKDIIDYVPESKEEDFDVGGALENIKEPVSKLGDLYQLDFHRLLCGDATKKEDVERLMDGKKADIGLTDPPYGVRKEEDWDEYGLFLKNLPFWIENIYQNCLFGFLWFCADKRLPDIFTITESRKIKFHRLLIWNKPEGTQFAGSMNNKLWYSLEPILVFDKKEINKNCGTDKIEYQSCEARTIPQKEHGHPTSKPIDLLTWLINHYSKNNQILLDPFLGSGTTLIACEKINRICYGMEKDPIYVDVIVRRWEEYTGKKAKKLKKVRNNARAA